MGLAVVPELLGALGLGVPSAVLEHLPELLYVDGCVVFAPPAGSVLRRAAVFVLDDGEPGHARIIIFIYTGSHAALYILILQSYLLTSAHA